MKKLVFGLCFISFVTLLCGCEKDVVNTNDSADNSTINNENTMIEDDDIMEEFTSKINITINNNTFSATLEDNETSREFVKRLPLNISMNELNGNEKYYYFDNFLPSNSTKIDQINPGDIMLYGDDCLVLFYKAFNTNYSYTRIGKLDNPSNIKNIVGNGNINIYISR